MLKLVMRDGEVFEGETHLDLVCAMKGDAKNVLEYIAVVQRRAAEMEGIDLDVASEKIDERCESLVRKLVRVKVAALEETPSNLTPLARLVQMGADVLYDGDLEAAWPLVRERMRLHRQERREIETQLGLGTAKQC